jgi:DNA-binding MarR family transcriptional regulator/RimJ/RimL family protein N-acetyltransferase
MSTFWSDSAATQLTESRVIEQVRAFNRFYTRVIGVLRDRLVGSPYSLVEARLLYELAHHTDGVEGARLRRVLDLDAGYLSRILARLEAGGLVQRSPDRTDGRRQIIGLTEAGRAEFSTLDRRQNEALHELLAPLSAERRGSVIAAMRIVRQALGDQTDDRPDRRTVVLRGLQPGDLGWVVARNGALYAREYGWGTAYEALVARVVADYAGREHAGREAGWIAEVDGEKVGAVFCMRSDSDDEHTARLRLLLVEPGARGLGVGGSLVHECLSFAEQAGYQRITLWTVSLLDAARRVYQRAGFTLDDEAPFAGFGQPVVAQNWSRTLHDL